MPLLAFSKQHEVLCVQERGCMFCPEIAFVVACAWEQDAFVSIQ